MSGDGRESILFPFISPHPYGIVYLESEPIEKESCAAPPKRLPLAASLPPLSPPYFCRRPSGYPQKILSGSTGRLRRGAIPRFAITMPLNIPKRLFCRVLVSRTSVLVFFRACEKTALSASVWLFASIRRDSLRHFYVCLCKCHL